MVMMAMHVLSTLIGAAFPILLSKMVTEIICVVLFLGFGAYMIYQAIFEDPNEEKECERHEIEDKLKEQSRSLIEGK